MHLGHLQGHKLSRYCSSTSAFDSHLEDVLALPPHSFLSTTMHLIFFYVIAVVNVTILSMNMKYRLNVKYLLYIMSWVRCVQEGRRSVSAPPSCSDGVERSRHEPASWQTHTRTVRRCVWSRQWSPFRGGAVDVMCSCSRQLMLMLGKKKN